MNIHQRFTRCVCSISIICTAGATCRFVFRKIDDRDFPRVSLDFVCATTRLDTHTHRPNNSTSAANRFVCRFLNQITNHCHFDSHPLQHPAIHNFNFRANGRKEQTISPNCSSSRIDVYVRNLRITPTRLRLFEIEQSAFGCPNV